MSWTVKVHSDRLGYVSRDDDFTYGTLLLTADEALQLLFALDAEVDRCHRCDKPLWLALSRCCGASGAGPYCDEHEPCGCSECRGAA